MRAPRSTCSTKCMKHIQDMEESSCNNRFPVLRGGLERSGFGVHVGLVIEVGDGDGDAVGVGE